MIREANPSDPAAEVMQSRNSFGSLLVRAAWIIASATLIIFLIFLSSGRIRLSQSGVEIVGAFVYSAMIGLPSIILLTWIGRRLGEEYPRLVYLVYAVMMVCTAAVGTLAGGLVLQLIGINSHGEYWREFRGSFPFAIVISLMFGLSISTFETMRHKLQAASLELRTRQVEQERAYKLLAEARLSSLESRIHPHFLFNTLNSIAALIPSDPVRAEQTVGNLASLLRFSLNANQSGLVPLAQELKIVRDYMEIEKTRFGARLRYEIDVPDELGEVGVPPLALQSLAENAVKHVVSRQPQGASIRVTGVRDMDRISLAVLDDGPGFSLDAITPEHGLGSLIARIELLYGGDGQLQVDREGDRTAVRLSFPA
jgi:two-component system, LytTR family, sensor histidine kinase AlgZ